MIIKCVNRDRCLEQRCTSACPLKFGCNIYCHYTRYHLSIMHGFSLPDLKRTAFYMRKGRPIQTRYFCKPNRDHLLGAGYSWSDSILLTQITLIKG